MNPRLLPILATAIFMSFPHSSPALEVFNDQNTLWLEDFKNLQLSEDTYQGWKAAKGEIHGVENGVGLTMTDGKEAQMIRYVMSRTPNFPYLQVRVTSMETPGLGLLIGNASTGGTILGWAPPGISTFDLSRQEFFGNDSKPQFRWALRLSALGKTGGSAVLESLAVVREPEEGLVVRRKNEKPPTDAIQSGETLLIELHTKKKLSSPPIVQFENLIDATEVRLGASRGGVKLKETGENLYSAEIILGPDSDKILTPPVENLPGQRWIPTLRASCDVNGVGYFNCLPFDFDVSGKAAEKSPSQKDWLLEVGSPAVAARGEWKDLTAGKNLAAGRPVTFSAPPTYALTHDENDPQNLTSGQLSRRADDRIWFSKDSVGWGDLAGPVNMMVDLGKSQPIGRVAIRLLGGKEQPILSYPKEIEVLVSEDGKDFRSAGVLTKLLESEKELADSSRFYIAEEGQAAVKTFHFDVGVTARYVAWRITPESSFLISDQLAVMAGDAKSEKKLASLPVAYPPLIMSGLAAFPRKGTLTITTGVTTPNWFMFQDDLDSRKKTDKVEFQFDLPAGIRLVSATPSQPVSESESAGPGRKIFHIEPRETNRKGFKPLQGPFYFTADETAAKKDKAVVRVAINGLPGDPVDVPLEVIHIDPVTPLTSQHVSLGWMSERYALGWPEFFKNYAGAGFNAFPVFPRSYTKTADGSEWSDETKAILALVEEARKRGLPIAYNESPFHTLEKLGPKVAPEAFNDLGGKPGTRLSPVYRGKFYQEEIERIGRNTAIVRPDIVFHDIELWHHSVEEGRNSEAMRQAFSNSGKSEKETLSDLGSEKMRDLRKAVNDAMPDSHPLVALYNNHAERPIYQYVFDWSKIYPDTVDFASPSLYVRGDCAVIHETMIANYRAVGNRKTMPWLTTGTYGEFDPKLVEPQIYETVLNGSWGFTYYCFHDFDPMDYYYQASAIRTLKPFDELIAKGDVLPTRCDSPNALVSAYGTEKAALLLVGNYNNPKAISAVVGFQGKSVIAASDLKSGEPVTLPTGSLSTEVPAFGYRIFHVEFGGLQVRSGT